VCKERQWEIQRLTQINRRTQRLSQINERRMKIRKRGKNSNDLHYMIAIMRSPSYDRHMQIKWNLNEHDISRISIGQYMPLAPLLFDSQSETVVTLNQPIRKCQDRIRQLTLVSTEKHFFNFTKRKTRFFQKSTTWKKTPSILHARIKKLRPNKSERIE